MLSAYWALQYMCKNFFKINPEVCNRNNLAGVLALMFSCSSGINNCSSV